MQKSHRQIMEEAIQARAGILKRERDMREQAEFQQKVKNAVDVLLNEQKEREQEYDTPYNGAIKKKSIRHKKYVEQMKGENKTMEEIKVNDNVNHPSHYEGHTSIDCIDAMILTFGVKRTAEYCVQNAYKYIWRHKYKNGIEDLKKAEWYLNKFDELVIWCETKFSADGTIETDYLEIGQILREMIKMERNKYEVNK